MKRIILAIFAATLLISNADASHHKRRVIRPTPSILATKSYLVADEDGIILKEQSSDVIRPIASISKLMVALLATEQNLTESLTIPTNRQVQSSIPRVVLTLTRRELLTLALVRSDNLAAQVLCTNLPDCVERMNSKALELGMLNTRYREPTGLDIGNVSTARDLLKLLIVASFNDIITDISSRPTAEIPTNKKPIKVHNTNPLTSTFKIILSKTGFTNPAGGCISMIIGDNAERRIIILLGSQNTRTRVVESLKLYKESL